MTTPTTPSAEPDLSAAVTPPTRPAKPRSRRPAAKPSAAYAAGLDVGYAYVKWLAADGTRELLPTAVAPLDLDGSPPGQLWNSILMPPPLKDPPLSHRSCGFPASTVIFPAHPAVHPGPG